MIIHPIEVTSDKDVFHFSAKIEWEKLPTMSKFNWYHPPETLWYKFPNSYKDVISPNYNSFLIPLVSVSMFLGEDIHVIGAISSKLAYSLNEYQRILHFWQPEWFSLIKITCEGYEQPRNIGIQKGAMCSFSGGVDSTYTLWSHLPQNELNAEFQVSHTLFIKGLDILEDKNTQKLKIESYTELMRTLGINLIPISSNCIHFHQFDDWPKLYMTFSSALVGTVIFFDDIVSKFYYSSDNTHDFELLSTINHLIVPLLSTEKIDIISYGGSVSKLEKIETIAKWPETYSRLIVCHKNPNGLKNCGRCIKCCLTMSTMDCAGVLHKYDTFPEIIDRKGIRRSKFLKEFLPFPKTCVKFAKARGKRKIAFDYSWVVFICTFEHHYRKFISPIRHMISYIPNPMEMLYKISYKCKQHSNAYAKFVDRVKGYDRRKKQ